MDEAEHWGETVGRWMPRTRREELDSNIAREPPSANAGRQEETVAEERKGERRKTAGPVCT